MAAPLCSSVIYLLFDFARKRLSRSKRNWFLISKMRIKDAQSGITQCCRPCMACGEYGTGLFEYVTLCDENPFASSFLRLQLIMFYCTHTHPIVPPHSDNVYLNGVAMRQMAKLCKYAERVCNVRLYKYDVQMHIVNEILHFILEDMCLLHMHMHRSRTFQLFLLKL